MTIDIAGFSVFSCFVALPRLFDEQVSGEGQVTESSPCVIREGV